jgi:hypothetical protein
MTRHMLLLGHTLRIHHTIEQLDRANHTISHALIKFLMRHRTKYISGREYWICRNYWKLLFFAFLSRRLKHETIQFDISHTLKQSARILQTVDTFSFTFVSENSSHLLFFFFRYTCTVLLQDVEDYKRGCNAQNNENVFLFDDFAGLKLVISP